MKKPSVLFWVIAVIALLWNAMGVFAFITDLTMSEEALALMTEAQQELYNSTPTWNYVGYGLATIGGLLGAIGLLMRKSWATSLFILSFIGVLINLVWSLFLSNAADIMGAAAYILPVMVVVIAIFLIWYSRKSTADGILT